MADAGAGMAESIVERMRSIAGNMSSCWLDRATTVAMVWSSHGISMTMVPTSWCIRWNRPAKTDDWPRWTWNIVRSQTIEAAEDGEHATLEAWLSTSGYGGGCDYLASGSNDPQRRSFAGSSKPPIVRLRIKMAVDMPSGIRRGYRRGDGMRRSRNTGHSPPG